MVCLIVFCHEQPSKEISFSEMVCMWREKLRKEVNVKLMDKIIYI